MIDDEFSLGCNLDLDKMKGKPDWTTSLEYVDERIYLNSGLAHGSNELATFVC